MKAKDLIKILKEINQESSVCIDSDEGRLLLRVSSTYEIQGKLVLYASIFDGQEEE